MNANSTANSTPAINPGTSVPSRSNSGIFRMRHQIRSRISAPAQRSPL
jgi:hypothetical protein